MALHSPVHNPRTIFESVSTERPSHEVLACPPSTKIPRAVALVIQVLLFDTPIILTVVIYPFFLDEKIMRERMLWSVALSRVRRARSPLAGAALIMSAQPNKDGKFLALTLLILLPAQVYYTLFVPRIAAKDLFTATWILYSLSLIFDPLLFMFSVDSFRSALKRVIRR
ncbi:hypothetical protein RvY_16275 [Ramazzottius varieornatus]|uniref:G-protein coupled receptors family 1 profile domain-containing protein n=1 Tax=Ramazzottius varieornatus TaxID=947166 RepID=A0A1D1VZ72_RAMVA|nr:hypothetical protein RvY_16275 [Ramazzottius varieornatus]